MRRQDVQKLRSAANTETRNALFQERGDKIEALIAWGTSAAFVHSLIHW